jgi:hypothetical protein
MMHNLFSKVFPILNSTAVAASGTSTDISGAWIDMTGYEGVAFLVAAATTGTGAFNAHVEMSSSSGGGSAVDVDASAAYFSTGFATSRAGLVVDVYRPTYQWVHCVVDRATTGESIENIWALLYHSGSVPTAFSTGSVSDVTIAVGTSGSAT